MTAAKPTAASSIFLPVRQEWLDRRKEEILDPSLPIVDPHHHLWERPGWRYLLPELLEDLNSGHHIVATVYLQARAMHRADGPEEMRPVGETEFVNGVAAMSASGTYGPAKICAGIVGHADFRLGAKVKPVLEAHLRTAGDRFRGIRHGTAWDAFPGLRNPAYDISAGLMADPAYHAGVACLEPLGLTLDAWLYHPQIEEFTALARAFPGIGMVLNHVGGPLGLGPYAGKRDEVFARWKTSIQALAKCPNAYVKLGGLGMKLNGFGFEDKADPPSSDELAAAWRPYIETCIEAFGVGRCMFESNFPVDKGSYSYPVFWNACKKLAKSASASETADLFSGTAARFYRLTLPA